MLFIRKKVNPSRVEQAVTRGISALAAMQQTDGSFPFMQRDPRGGNWEPCHPLFSTLTVLLSAGSLLGRMALDRALSFVLACRRSDGLWIYDPGLDIPPDSDDTACALAVLAKYRPEAVSSEDSVLLRSFWRPDGGPFETWRGGGSNWHSRIRDDAVVNSNILLALRALGAEPALEESQAVLKLVLSSVEGSRYYCAPVTVAYAAKRAGFAPDNLPRQLLRKPGAKTGILPAAQWLCIIAQWESAILSYLLEQQAPDGSWPVEPWCTDTKLQWGDAAITTAICVEALHNLL